MADKPTLYVKEKRGKRTHYIEYELPDAEVLDLTEWNKRKEEYYRSDGLPGSFAGVTCPSPTCDGLMMFRSETIVSNQLNLPARREVACRECGRAGRMII